jgi:RND family efflux transporter MFP subunit
MSTPDQQPAPHADTHDDVPREILTQALSRRTPIWKPIALSLALIVLVGGVIAVGALPRVEAGKDLRETNDRLTKLAHRVQIGAIRTAPGTRTLTLPASLQPNAKADLFAQATGYVRERHADIGDRVKAGDVLAIIDIPLIEEDIVRAEAALKQAEAARAEVDKARQLARSTLERWKNVQPAGAVSKQEIDERAIALETAEAAYSAADAAVATRRSEVQRIERQRSFAKVIAPFDGTVTARNTDIGDYISSAGPSGSPMFSIADTKTIRVYADVPQVYAQGITIGQNATVLLRETGSSKHIGKVTRTSGALNERSRTLRVEVTLNNEDGRVLAGAYGQVQFDVPQPNPAVIVAGSSILVRAEGTRVAIVDDHNQLKYVPITLGRDLGNEIEVTAGLTGKERVVINMADELPEGTVVEIIPAAKPPSAPIAPAGKPPTAGEGK